MATAWVLTIIYMFGQQDAATSQKYGPYDTQALCEKAASEMTPITTLKGNYEPRNAYLTSFFTCTPEYARAN
jgi:ATP sulfurylase